MAVQYSLPQAASAHHQGTTGVLEAVPLSDLQWSLLCVAIMRPAYPTIGPLIEPRTHNLVTKAGSPPDWKIFGSRRYP